MNTAALPVTITFFLVNISTMINLFFVGHIGASELAAASLAISFWNLVAFSFGLGLISAMDTFCTQAYGAENYALVGVYLQRAVLITSVYCLLIGAVLFNTRELLVLTGQDPAIAAMAAQYVRLSMPALWPQLMFEAMRKWLQAQAITTPMMWIQLLVNAINALAQYVLVYALDIGFIGSPIGFTLASILAPVFLYFYARLLLWPRVGRTWAGWSREAFREWLPYLKVAFPSAMMMCLEWWGFEIMIVLAGLLGPVSLAASEIHITLLNFVYMLPLGIAVAVNIRVGNLLGAGRPFKARHTSYVGLIFIWVCMLCISGAVFAIRRYWGRVYSNDEEVVQLVAHVLPVACITVVLDGNQAVSSGILRGCGRVVLGAILNLIAYYIVSLPVGLLLAFSFKLGLLGLWSGMAVAEIVVVAFFLFFIFRMDWVRVSHEARERSAVESREELPSVEEVAHRDMELIQRHPLTTGRMDSEEHFAAGSAAATLYSSAS